MHELKIVNGTVKTNGSKAYVEQEPFIMSGTVMENILVGLEYDEEKFKNVIEVC